MIFLQYKKRGTQMKRFFFKAAVDGVFGGGTHNIVFEGGWKDVLVDGAEIAMQELNELVEPLKTAATSAFNAPTPEMLGLPDIASGGERLRALRETQTEVRDLMADLPEDLGTKELPEEFKNALGQKVAQFELEYDRNAEENLKALEWDEYDGDSDVDRAHPDDFKDPPVEEPPAETGAVELQELDPHVTFRGREVRRPPVEEPPRPAGPEPGPSEGVEMQDYTRPPTDPPVQEPPPPAPDAGVEMQDYTSDVRAINKDVITEVMHDMPEFDGQVGVLDLENTDDLLHVLKKMRAVPWEEEMQNVDMSDPQYVRQGDTWLQKQSINLDEWIKPEGRLAEVMDGTGVTPYEQEVYSRITSEIPEQVELMEMKTVSLDGFRKTSTGISDAPAPPAPDIPVEAGERFGGGEAPAEDWEWRGGGAEPITSREGGYVRGDFPPLGDDVELGRRPAPQPQVLEDDFIEAIEEKMGEVPSLNEVATEMASMAGGEGANLAAVGWDLMPSMEEIIGGLGGLAIGGVFYVLTAELVPLISALVDGSYLHPGGKAIYEGQRVVNSEFGEYYKLKDAIQAHLEAEPVYLWVNDNGWAGRMPTLGGDNGRPENGSRYGYGGLPGMFGVTLLQTKLPGGTGLWFRCRLISIEGQKAGLMDDSPGMFLFLRPGDDIEIPYAFIYEGNSSSKPGFWFRMGVDGPLVSDTKYNRRACVLSNYKTIYEHTNFTMPAPTETVAEPSEPMVEQWVDTDVFYDPDQNWWGEDTTRPDIPTGWTWNEEDYVVAPDGTVFDPYSDPGSMWDYAVDFKAAPKTHRHQKTFGPDHWRRIAEEKNAKHLRRRDTRMRKQWMKGYRNRNTVTGERGFVVESDPMSKKVRDAATDVELQELYRGWWEQGHQAAIDWKDHGHQDERDYWDAEKLKKRHEVKTAKQWMTEYQNRVVDHPQITEDFTTAPPVTIIPKYFPQPKRRRLAGEGLAFKDIETSDNWDWDLLVEWYRRVFQYLGYSPSSREKGVPPGFGTSMDTVMARGRSNRGGAAKVFLAPDSATQGPLNGLKFDFRKDNDGGMDALHLALRSRGFTAGSEGVTMPPEDLMYIFLRDADDKGSPVSGFTDAELAARMGMLQNALIFFKKIYETDKGEYVRVNRKQLTREDDDWFQELDRERFAILEEQKRRLAHVPKPPDPEPNFVENEPPEPIDPVPLQAPENPELLTPDVVAGSWGPYRDREMMELPDQRSIPYKGVFPEDKIGILVQVIVAYRVRTGYISKVFRKTVQVTLADRRDNKPVGTYTRNFTPETLFPIVDEQMHFVRVDIEAERLRQVMPPPRKRPPRGAMRERSLSVMREPLPPLRETVPVAAVHTALPESDSEDEDILDLTAAAEIRNEFSLSPLRSVSPSPERSDEFSDMTRFSPEESPPPDRERDLSMTPFTREITERLENLRSFQMPTIDEAEIDDSQLLVDELPLPPSKPKSSPAPVRPRTVVEERVEGRGGAAIGAILAALAFLVLASYLD